MRKSFFDTELWKWIRTIIQLIGIVLLILAIISVVDFFMSTVRAEGDDGETAYAICVMDDVVNIRATPKTKGEWIGYLNPGDMVRLDGKKQNGYAHCVDMNTESGEGWVFAGYLVGDCPYLVDCDAEIISNGRLAARKYVNGKRTKWLKPNATLHVYYMSGEWCSTNCGYVQTKFLRMEEE